MTSECNIEKGFEVGAAFKIEPTVVSIENGLGTLMNLSEEMLVEAGEAGRSLVENEFTWEKVAAETYAVYEWILKGGQVPECVREY